MITNIYIRNFKSISYLALNLEKFNCLIGMNGVGKSTILQAIDFISQLMTGNVQGWLDSRGWEVQDLNCKLRKDSNIMLSGFYRLTTGKELHWFASFNRHTLRFSSESIEYFDGSIETIFESTAQGYIVKGREKQHITFTYQGSILSQLKDSELIPEIIEFRDALRNIRSLELLSPHLLRKRSRNDEKDIGAGGEKLSAYLHNIKGEARIHLLALLKQFYPNLIDFRVVSQRAGWKKLMVTEQFGEQKLETEATHLSDGLLRILAVLAQAESNHPLVLLDEIENGINPEIIEKLVDMLVAARQQIIVTTHSPMILNYLEDKTARESVQFVYKNPQGGTKARKFFGIPDMGEKLEFMGAGEAFVDTNLTELTKTCVALDEQEEAQKLAEKSAKGKA
jgi:predicted ATPase